MAGRINGVRTLTGDLSLTGRVAFHGASPIDQPALIPHADGGPVQDREARAEVAALNGVFRDHGLTAAR